MITALWGADRRYTVGELWQIVVLLRDDHGTLTDSVPTVAVTLPSGSAAPAPTVVQVTTGVYRASVELTTPGRWLAQVTDATVDGILHLAAVAAEVVGNAAFPTADDCIAYLESINGGSTSVTDDEVESQLAAELEDQQARCEIDAVYPVALRMALLRRVARGIAVRPLLLGLARGESESGLMARVPQLDAEIRRLETPYLRLVIG